MNNEQLTLAVAIDLTELKCGDCLRLHPTGWLGQPTCETTGFPVQKTTPACISILSNKPEIRELFNT